MLLALPSVLLALPAPAAAAPVVVVPGRAASVVVVVEAADGVRGVACADGAPPDDGSADGRWGCGQIDAHPQDRVGVLLDGRFLDAGGWSGGDTVAIAVDGARVTLAGSSAALPAPAASSGSADPSAAPARGAVLARVVGVLPDAPAPIVRLVGGGGQVELGCRDDGGFPDLEKNDGVRSCVGAAPADTVEVQLDAGRRLGTARFAPGAALRFLTVDAQKGSVDTAPFPLRVRPSDVPAPTAAGGDGSSGSSPQAPPQPPPGPRPVAAPEPSLRPDAPADARGWRWPSVAVAFGLGALGAWAFGRRGRALPRGVRAVTGAPLMPGGPSVGGVPGVVRVADLDAAAAESLAALVRTHRVLFVPRPGTSVPAVAGHAVYACEGTDRLRIEDAARALAAQDGAPLAVLVVGSGTVQDPGGVAGHPLALLADGIGSAWLLVVSEPDADLPFGPPAA